MNSPQQIEFGPLGGGGFGISVSVQGLADLSALDVLLNSAEVLRQKFQQADGLMLVRGLDSISSAPEQLVTLSHIFGSEVENYRETLTAARFFHEVLPEILVLSNLPPCNHPPPPRPDSPLSSASDIPVQFPDRKNWHTDQSYRRPPPDITLLYGVINPPADQGQTMFADCTAAYEALDANMKRRLTGLYGLHAPGWVGVRLTMCVPATCQNRFCRTSCRNAIRWSACTLTSGSRRFIFVKKSRWILSTDQLKVWKRDRMGKGLGCYVSYCGTRRGRSLSMCTSGSKVTC